MEHRPATARWQHTTNHVTAGSGYTTLKKFMTSLLLLLLFVRPDSLKSLQMVLQQQSMVLHQIAEKLEVGPSPGLGVPSSQHRMSIVPPDGGLHAAAGHDSLQVGRAGNTVVERPGRRSVRITVDKKDRPPSTVL